MASPTVAAATASSSAYLLSIHPKSGALRYGVMKADDVESNAPAATKIAPYPFDNMFSDADVILQSADGTHFYLHKSTMRVASRFFSEMFSLPQPPPVPPNAGTASSQSELPIIPVTEDSSTLETLLRLCYPVEVPEKHDTRTLAAVLGAALKYEMRVITASLTKALSWHVAASPLYVFAVAYKCDLLQVAGDAFREFTAWCKFRGGKPGPGHAAKASYSYKRTHSLDEYSPELDSLPVAVYYRLLERHAATKHPSAHTPSSPQSDDADATVKSIMSCPSDPVYSPEEEQFTGRLQHPFQDQRGADTIIRSSDYAEFHVHRSFLAFASPAFTLMLSPIPPTPPSDTTNETDRDTALPSVHHLPEDGRTLSRLFQLSYPMPDPELASLGPADTALGPALALLCAARKYEVPRAIAFAKRACIAVAQEKPVQLYLIASRYKWDDVARDAAMRAVYETSDRYLPEMEDSSAAAYRRLLVYRQKCRDIILSGGEPTNPAATNALPVTPAATPPDPDRPRNVRAPYWSTSSWLSCPGEARFWRALHEYVKENMTPTLESTEELTGDIEAMLPRSVVNDNCRTSRGGAGGDQTPIPQEAEPIPEPTLGQQELKRIARALAKVRL